MKTVFGMKKSFHVILHMLGDNFFKPNTLDAIFAQSFRGFAKVLTDFAQISADFADFQEFFHNFHHIKTLGVRFHPHPLRH